MEPAGTSAIITRTLTEVVSTILTMPMDTLSAGSAATGHLANGAIQLLDQLGFQGCSRNANTGGWPARRYPDAAGQTQNTHSRAFRHGFGICQQVHWYSRRWMLVKHSP